MNTKRILALLAALLMIVALFSACSNDTNKDDGQKTDGNGDKTDGNSGDDANSGDDTPDEADIVTITWLASGTSDKYQLAVDGNYENLRQCVEVQHKYGFEVDTSFAASEVYTNTINSLAAAGQLPQVYGTYGAVDNNTIVEWINAGRFVACEDILEYSTGNMIKAFGDDGLYDWARAKATHTDGKFYYVMITNDPARGLQITEEDGPLRVKVQLHGIYGLMIRQDWLDDLGLAMPTTAEEYYDACLAMHTQDVNGNGMNDERIIIGLGTEYQYQGVGQWFGLPYQDFFSDPSSGEVEVGMLKKGYGDWASYLNKFYSEQLVYNNEGGHPWQNSGTYIAENNVISWYCQANNIWSTGRSNSGDEDCNYQPMPIIAAVEGEKARIICQEATAGEWGISFNADSITAEDAAKFVDYIYSYEMWLLFYYGVEGQAWEYAEDGVNIIDYTAAADYKQGDIEQGYMPFDNMGDGFFMGFLSYTPTARDDDLWNPRAATYNSAQEALDAGEPYAEANITVEAWMAQNDVDYNQPNWVQLTNLANWGEENINVAAYYDFETLPTAEEAAVQSQYATDLKTYVVELGAKLVMGEYNVADLQSYIDYAYENLGLQEYIDAQQARVDRFMDAMGL